MTSALCSYRQPAHAGILKLVWTERLTEAEHEGLIRWVYDGLCSLLKTSPLRICETVAFGVVLFSPSLCSRRADNGAGD